MTKLALVVYWLAAYGPAMDFIPMDLCQELAGRKGAFALELDEDFQIDEHLIPKGDSLTVDRVECFAVERHPCREESFCF